MLFFDGITVVACVRTVVGSCSSVGVVSLSSAIDFSSSLPLQYYVCVKVEEEKSPTMAMDDEGEILSEWYVEQEEEEEEFW